MVQDWLSHVRALALALPGVDERVSHGEPCFFLGPKALCYFHDNHRGDGRVALWCPAPPGAPEEAVASEPRRFFRPPESAAGAFAGWIGLYLDATGDDRVDWDEVAAVLADAYRTTAPSRTRIVSGASSMATAVRGEDAEASFRFRSELWMHSGGAWRFVTLPGDLAAEIEDQAGPPRGFGSVKVIATIGSTTWNTSIFPDSSTRTFVLPVKKRVRVAEKLNDGDLIDVSLVLAVCA